MSSRKWLGICLAVTVIAALVMVAVVYVVDPLNYIRWNDGPRFFNSGVSFIPGIVRNYGANTYLIGSSMIQNTDMQYMRDSGGGLTVVKLEKSGMTVNETLMVLRVIQSQAQSPDALINIDFVTFFTEDKIGPASDNFKGYLYNYSSLDDWKYFFDYDVWYRYLPVTLGMMAIDVVFGRLPEMLDSVTNIDDIGTTHSLATAYGRELMIRNYKAGVGGTSKYTGYNLEAIKENIDDFIGFFEDYTSDFSSVTIGIAPYSALWWHVQKEDGTMDTLLEAKAYLEERLLELGNVKIADVQAVSDQIANLEHYKDQTHFDSTLQKVYTDAMLSPEGTITSVDDIAASRQRLEDIVVKFEEENVDWL